MKNTLKVIPLFTLFLIPLFASAQLRVGMEAGSNPSLGFLISGEMIPKSKVKLIMGFGASANLGVAKYQQQYKQQYKQQDLQQYSLFAVAGAKFGVIELSARAGIMIGKDGYYYKPNIGGQAGVQIAEHLVVYFGYNTFNKALFGLMIRI